MFYRHLFVGRPILVRKEARPKNFSQAPTAGRCDGQAARVVDRLRQLLLQKTLRQGRANGAANMRATLGHIETGTAQSAPLTGLGAHIDPEFSEEGFALCCHLANALADHDPPARARQIGDSDAEPPGEVTITQPRGAQLMIAPPLSHQIRCDERRGAGSFHNGRHGRSLAYSAVRRLGFVNPSGSPSDPQPCRIRRMPRQKPNNRAVGVDCFPSSHRPQPPAAVIVALRQWRRPPRCVVTWRVGRRNPWAGARDPPAYICRERRETRRGPREGCPASGNSA